MLDDVALFIGRIIVHGFLYSLIILGVFLVMWGINYLTKGGLDISGGRSSNGKHYE